ERDFGGKFRSLDHFEKGMLGLQGAVLRESTACLAHKPDRGTIRRSAAAGGEKAVAVGVGRTVADNGRGMSGSWVARGSRRFAGGGRRFARLNCAHGCARKGAVARQIRRQRRLAAAMPPRHAIRIIEGIGPTVNRFLRCSPPLATCTFPPVTCFRMTVSDNIR